MIGALINAWKLIYQTFLEHRIGRIMYYYLVSLLFVLGGLYFYMLWQGTIGFALLLSVLAGAKLPPSSPAITVVQAIGMLLIIRYTMFGVLDEIAKRPNERFGERLTQLEEKVNDLHSLTFTGMMSAERKREVIKKLREQKNSVKIKVVKK